MELFTNNDAIVKSQKQKLVVCSRLPTELHQYVELQLFRISPQITQGAMFSIIKKMISKNLRMKNQHVVTYNQIHFLTSKDIKWEDIKPGNYVALIRFDEPLASINWKLMDLKSKLGSMVNIAKTVQSLHLLGKVGLQLARKNIFQGNGKSIKIGNIFKSELEMLSTNSCPKLPFQSADYTTKTRFDIWSLAVIFIEILINGRLDVKWNNPEGTLKSIRSFLKYSQHFIPFSIGQLIRKMIKSSNKQMGIDKVVRRFSRLNRMSEEAIRRTQSPLRQTTISFISNNLPAANLDVPPANQRILIINSFQIFLTLSADGHQLSLELTTPDKEGSLLSAAYTYTTLPSEIRKKYQNIAAFFYFLQTLHPQSFTIIKQGALLIKSI